MNKSWSEKGIFWWYRLLTGRQYTTPYQNHKDNYKYYKQHRKLNYDIPCKGLNVLQTWSFRFFSHQLGTKWWGINMNVLIYTISLKWKM